MTAHKPLPVHRAAHHSIWVRAVAVLIVFALGVKLLVLGLAAAGYATLWMAVAADVGASLLVIFNGTRLLKT